MTGYRIWNTGDSVSAADFTSYIATQSVLIFADASARSSAVTSPVNGMVSSLTTDNVISIYNGSAWVDVLDIDTLTVSGGNYTVTGTMTYGASGSGVDVTFHSATAGDYAMWDASEEKLILEGTHSATVLDVTDGNVVIGDGTLTVGSDGAGEDVTFYSDTSGDSFVWDSSAEKLILEGTNGATVLDVTDGNVVIGDGTLTVGSDGAGEDVQFFSATAGDHFLWQSAQKKLTIEGTNGADALNVADGNMVVQDGTLTVGANGAGYDVTFHSGTASDNFLWDASDEKLVITGTDGQNALEVADGNVEITDKLTVTGQIVTHLTVETDSTTTHAPAVGDENKYILTTHGTGIVVTLPQNSAQGFAIGTTIYYERNGAGTLTFAAGTGATVTSKSSVLTCADRYTAVAAIKIGTNAWSLIGNIG